MYSLSRLAKVVYVFGLLLALYLLLEPARSQAQFRGTPGIPGLTNFLAATGNPFIPNDGRRIGLPPPPLMMPLNNMFFGLQYTDSTSSPIAMMTSMGGMGMGGGMMGMMGMGGMGMGGGMMGMGGMGMGGGMMGMGGMMMGGMGGGMMMGGMSMMGMGGGMGGMMGMGGMSMMGMGGGGMSMMGGFAGKGMGGFNGRNAL